MELVEQGEDAAFDLVADRAHGGDVQVVRVVQYPFLVPLAREHWATFASAFRRWRAKRSASSGRKLTTVARAANWS